jgi:glutaredoxin 3
LGVKIELYTKIYCAYCQRAKELLRIKGVEFIEYDITDDQLKAAEMQRRSLNQTLPGIFINDAPVGGCTELFDLDERGILDTLLGLMPASGESLQ